jgi:hypothetical protein
MQTPAIPITVLLRLLCLFHQPVDPLLGVSTLCVVCDVELIFSPQF